MFSYYGSKSKIISLYPPPKENTIIEPFAGSARYCLKYWDNEIFIYDKFETIINLWKFLQQASEDDILKLPKLKKGMKINELNISDEEKMLLGFFANSGSTGPGNTVTTMGENSCKSTPNRYKAIANNLHKIRHWNIVQGCYTDIKNTKATWFIDPPYQFGGEHYKEPNKNINFNELGDWSKSRNGHVIVCENTKADWLDFKPMTKIQGTAQTNTTEAIWSNIPTSFDCTQLQIF